MTPEFGALVFIGLAMCAIGASIERRLSVIVDALRRIEHLQEAAIGTMERESIAAAARHRR